MKKFRFGLQISSASSAEKWRELCKKAEDSGFDTITLPDHLQEQFSPIPALAFGAHATSKISLGTLVLDNDFRHPLIMAREMATLQFLSERTVELGIGAGWMKVDYEQSGIEMKEPRERVNKMAEAVCILKDLIQNGQSSYSGQHYQLKDAVLYPKINAEKIKLLIGGGSKKVLTIAGKQADIVGLNASLRLGEFSLELAPEFERESMLQKLEWVKDAAGERFDSLELQCLTFFVAVCKDREEFISENAEKFGLNPSTVKEMTAALIGNESQIIETLLMRRELYGFSYIVLHEGDLEPMKNIVATLANT